jgi:hypothetical protein
MRHPTPRRLGYWLVGALLLSLLGCQSAPAAAPAAKPAAPKR